MRKLLIIFSLMLITVCAFAQTDGSFNYSIAVRSYGILQLPKIQNDSKKDNYANAYFNSIMLKFNDNQISYRLGGSYFHENMNFEESDAGSGDITDYTIKMGFEKNFNYGVVQPYFLTDLGYRSHEFEGIINTSTQTKATKHGFTIAPGFGFKVNVISRLTLFAEGNIEFFYFQDKMETTPAGTTSRNINKNYQSQFLLNPLFAGITLHFGDNR